jgi:hypothetical protein
VLVAIFEIPTISRNLRMKPFTVSILFWFATFLWTCSAQKTTKTVKQVFNQEQFDTAVISHLYLYDSLKNILLANIDTIFNYRKSKRTSENKPIPIPLEELSYNFIYIAGKGESSDKISIETLPAPIYSKVDNICHQLGSNGIVGFDLQRNKIIVNIIVKNNDDEETLAETQHALTWNWDHRTDESELEKDSVLGNGWIYYIQTDVWKGR